MYIYNIYYLGWVLVLIVCAGMQLAETSASQSKALDQKQLEIDVLRSDLDAAHTLLAKLQQAASLDTKEYTYVQATEKIHIRTGN